MTDGPRADVMPAREVPLGGLRDMNVQRALPQRALPTVGAWCFLDRFGPQRVTMRVEPHPHMGLQTVTWPLTGEVRHRDSLGSDVVLRAGQLNLMTAGAGVAHSEYSLGDGDTELDALQLWIALPEQSRHGDRGFERHETLPTVTLPAREGADAVATVVMGSLAGVTSPATTHTPLVGAQIRVAPGSRVGVPLDAAWEHAVVVLEGELDVHASSTPEGEATRPGHNDLLYLGTGRDGIEVSSPDGALLFLLGGEPLTDELVMWWNFVGRSHEEIAQAWHDWQGRSARFGDVAGHGDVRIPAPPMPAVRLTPRRRRDQGKRTVSPTARASP
ncbi:pirin family protein [Demequina sp. TTPB684]|uniref:pirin family protein n=1 Tax=unclassified Demequina TaxID=2620311 RepID=UPI001CF178D4|nr:MULTISPECIES: pirin family protein [unclassified Demequina]MCB2412748.1 pirin family protein [Demequina sp. TTPB684]UPU88874.1 pirin family protein [Demequina sp. TMPB413]